MNYSAVFGDHSIAATLLYGASERKENYTSALARKFLRLSLGFDALESGTDQFVESNAWSEALLYQMARVNYKWKDRYLLTASLRYDGASVLADGHKWAAFPSAAIAGSPGAIRITENTISRTPKTTGMIASSRFRMNLSI